MSQFVIETLFVLFIISTKAAFDFSTAALDSSTYIDRLFQRLFYAFLPHGFHQIHRNLLVLEAQES